MRFSLRTLVALTVVGPPLLAGIWLWGSDILLAIMMLVAVLLAIGMLLLILAIPLAIPFALAGLFWLIQKGIIWLVGKVFEERQDADSMPASWDQCMASKYGPFGPRQLAVILALGCAMLAILISGFAVVCYFVGWM
jgi:hypothetical protein